MVKRILLVGGGSGGHVFPLVAVARALREQSQRQSIALELMILAEDGLVTQAARENQVPFRRIRAGKLRRYFSFLTLLDLIKIPVGLLQSLWHVFWFMPDAVFSKGGYDSVLPALVARLYAIPVFIHETDAIPGLANRLVSRVARTVFISFASSAQYFPSVTTVLVGNPVRQELFSGAKDQALGFFKFSPDKKTILVLGGSQGAREINAVVLESLVELVGDYQVIHQCGQGQYAAVKAEVDKDIAEGEGSYAEAIRSRYRLYPFLNTQELTMAYAVCDIVISRAGGSIFELAMLGKPAIVIPLKAGSRGEQLANAMEFSKYGAVIVEGANMTPHILMSQLRSLLEPSRYAQVGQQIRSFATPGAAEKIAMVLLS